MPESHRVWDVVVLGGGPAGVAAACLAAERGSQVLLLENTPWLGGPIWRANERASVPRAGRQWLRRLERSGAKVRTETTAFATYSTSHDASGRDSQRTLYTECGNELLEVRCRRLVLAVGTHELFLPFPGWTLPNVFGVGGLQLLAKSGWPVRGKQIVVAGSGPLLFAVAATLRRRGAHVTDMIEQAPRSRVMKFALSLPRLAPAKVVQALGYQRSLIGVRYRPGCWPVAAQGADAIRSVVLTDGDRTWQRDCDYLACAFGLVPSLQWPQLLGCAIRDQSVEVDRWQQTSVTGVYSAGEATGIGGVDAALVEGQIAGYAASGGDDEAEIARLSSLRNKARRFATALSSAFHLRDELFDLADDATIVCRCEDVTWGQLKEHDCLRSAKLLTRCGMGPCQGRVCHSALRLLKPWQTDSVRPPVLPTSVAALAAVQDGSGSAVRTPE